MSGKPGDGQIDQLLRARWLEIGLAQADLAELLGAALQPVAQGGDAATAIDTGRLAQLAHALGILRPAGETGHKIAPWLAEQGSPQSLLQLRLLRAFCQLRDHRAQRMLVYLAEQLAKCAATRPGDAG